MDKREETYHMTDKEMARLVVAERLIAGEITVKGAAEVLGISTRQVKRIKKKVRTGGPAATVHGNRDRKPANAVAGNIKDLVVELKRKKYEGTNFSHFAELIAEKEYIDLSRPTVHRILRGAGIVSPKKKKKTNRQFPSELRYDVGSKDWVVIATGRAKRPETFKKERRKMDS